MSQSYYKGSKTIRLNATNYFIMKIPNKRELKDSMKLDKDYTKEPYSFLVNDTTLSLDNALRFSKNLL